MTYDYTTSPEWANNPESQSILRKNCLEGETVTGMFERVAHGVDKHLSLPGLGEAVYKCLHRGWIGLATPVQANFNAPPEADRGLPVSCFGLTTDNSIYGLFETLKEGAMLSKNGGGLGVDLTPMQGISPVTHWASLFDRMAQVVSQGSTRRGAVALYLDINHPDIEIFLTAKNPRGDHHNRLFSNVAIIIDDDFMNRMLSGGEEEKKLFAKILELRMKTGVYIQYSGNVEKLRPQCYKERGLQVNHSQLCSEILLHDSADVTYSCVLSSMNLDRYEEWKDEWFWVNGEMTSPVEVGIFLLEAVTTEFIEKASKIRGLERAVKGAELGRPLGLGVMGLHSLYQSKGLAFESEEARELNKQVMSLIKEKALLASRRLAGMFGEPDWCKGSGLRHTHRLAIAPTISNSALLQAGSPGINPHQSNVYVFEGATGNFLRKNKYLAETLQRLEMDTPEVWGSIEERDGSVQHLPIPNHIKQVFRTAREIDQMAIIEQAADRQAIMDGEQGQSLNLFLNHDVEAGLMWKLHIEAWRKGITCLYYIHSTSPHRKIGHTLQETNPGQYTIKGRTSCQYCNMAKDLLGSQGLEYVFEHKPEGQVPVIYKDGELVGDGSYEALVRSLGLGSNLNSITCSGCDG